MTSTVIDQIARLGGPKAPRASYISSDWQRGEAALSVPTFGILRKTLNQKPLPVVPQYTDNGRFAGPLTQFKDLLSVPGYIILR